MTDHTSNSQLPMRTALVTCTILALAVVEGRAAVQVEAGVSYFAGTNPSGVAAADLNGDGTVDLATTVDGPDRITVLIGDGSGAFAAGPSSALPASSSPQDVVSGDWDGDEDADLAVAVRDPQGSVLIMLNNGAGTFTMSATVIVGDRPRGLAVGDMEGDGDLDIALANRDSDTASVLVNDGLGAFTALTVAAGVEPRAAAFADFEGDGDLDLAVTNADDRTVSLYVNAAGSFMAAGVLSVGPFVRPDGIATADLDGNGTDDLAVATSDQTLNINQVSVFANMGGVFGGPFEYPTDGTNTSDVIAVDLDCDGVSDLVASNSDSNDLSFLPNVGGAVFGAATVEAAGTRPGRLAASDLDGDGDADVTVANGDSSDLTVFINGSCAAVVGDLNGDGLVDANDLAQLLGSWGPCAGCPADLTGDGLVDANDLAQLLGNWG